MLAPVQTIFLDPFGKTRPPTSLVRSGRAEQSPRAQHVERADTGHGETEGREAEEGEALMAVPDQLALDDEVGRGGDEGHHAADQRCNAERHHQPAWRDPGIVGNTQHHRDEDGDDCGRAHHRTDRGDDEHQQDYQSRLAVPGMADEEVAEHAGDAGPHQRFADHEHARDHHDVRIAEARERLLDADHTRQRQSGHHHERDHVHSWPVHREHDDRGGE
jgi:hypothetical protein